MRSIGLVFFAICALFVLDGFGQTCFNHEDDCKPSNDCKVKRQEQDMMRLMSKDDRRLPMAIFTNPRDPRGQQELFVNSFCRFCGQKLKCINPECFKKGDKCKPPSAFIMHVDEAEDCEYDLEDWKCTTHSSGQFSWRKIHSNLSIKVTLSYLYFYVGYLRRIMELFSDIVWNWIKISPSGNTVAMSWEKWKDVKNNCCAWLSWC